MPSSAEEGREIMVKWMRAWNPRSLLDIGAGCGTYALPWQSVAPRPYLIGVEVWRPYVTRFDLNNVYDQVIVKDILELRPEEWPRVDVVVLGDVLEHMTVEAATLVWSRARQVARQAVFLSIPIVHSPQGAVHGNPHEEHVVDDWSFDRVIGAFPGIHRYWRGTIVGRFEASPL